MKIYHRLGRVMLVVEDLGFRAKKGAWGNEILVEVLSEEGLVDTLVQSLQPDEDIEDLLIHTGENYSLVAA
jgi:hypothetical protein